MAKRKYKIGKLIIGGDEYPACINVRAMMELEESGVDLDGALTDGPRRWSNLIKIMAKALEEGAALSGTGEEPPTADELAAMVDISDLQDVSGQLGALLGGKGRTVEAEPPKN